MSHQLDLADLRSIYGGLGLAKELRSWGRSVEGMRITRHTCPDGSNKVYVFPPVQGCSACEAYVERRVRANHWEMPHRLFGWDVIVYMIYLENQRKIDQKDANLQRGAYI